VIYLGILGGGATRDATMMSIIATIVWLVVGIGYLIGNSRASDRKIISTKLSK